MDIFADFPESARNDVKKGKDLDDFSKYLIELYIKVGSFFGWSWDQFLDTPWDAIDYMNMDIDERLLQYNTATAHSGMESGPRPLSYMHLSILLAMASMFGSKDE